MVTDKTIAYLTELLGTDDGRRAFYDLIWEAAGEQMLGGKIGELERKETLAIGAELIDLMSEDFPHPCGHEFI